MMIAWTASGRNGEKILESTEQCLTLNLLRNSFVMLALCKHFTQLTHTSLAIAERWQGYFAGRAFSDTVELVREDRER
jgi:hypothetical protein